MLEKKLKEEVDYIVDCMRQNKDIREYCTPLLEKSVAQMPEGSEQFRIGFASQVLEKPDMSDMSNRTKIFAFSMLNGMFKSFWLQEMTWSEVKATIGEMLERVKDS